MFKIYAKNNKIYATGKVVTNFCQLPLKVFLKKYPAFKNSPQFKLFDFNDTNYVVRFNFKELPFVEVGYPSDAWKMFDN